MSTKFYIIHVNYPPFLPIIDDFNKNQNRDFFDFMKFQKIENIKDKIFFFDKMKKGKGIIPLICIGYTGIMNLLVISSKITEKFKELLPNIELFPAIIHDCDLQYFVVNLLDEIDCIDYEIAKIKWSKKQPLYDNVRFIDGGSFSFKFYTEREYPVLFRPKHIEKFIIVTEQFKLFAEENGIADNFIFQDITQSSKII